MIKNINGYVCLLIVLILEGLFPIFSFFALQNMPTLWLITISTAVSMLLGLIVFFKKRLYNQYDKKEILVPTFFSALFLGTGGILYFFGIKYSSPSIAAILLLLQSFFAFIIFNLLGNEEYHKKQIIGAILMFLGGIIILYDGSSFLNLGVIIMLIAGISFTVGNYYTKKASLKGANPFFLLVHRNLLMVFVTSILALIFVGPIQINIIQQNLIWIFLIGSLVLFLGKTLWIISLEKLNSFVAISSFPVIPFIVMIFSFLFLNEIPNSIEILGFIPIFIGALLLVKQK